MKISNKQRNIIEQQLLKELPIKIVDNVITYNDYVIKQDHNGYWNLYANFNGLDLVDRFYLKISALMAAKKYEKCMIRDFKFILSMDQHYAKLDNDITHFRYQMKKTNDTVKKDNYLFRLQECYITISNIKEQIQQMYRTSF